MAETQSRSQFKRLQAQGAPDPERRRPDADYASLLKENEILRLGMKANSDAFSDEVRWRKEYQARAESAEADRERLMRENAELKAASPKRGVSEFTCEFCGEDYPWHHKKCGFVTELARLRAQGART